MMRASNAVFDAFSPLFSNINIDFEEVGTEIMPFPSFPLVLIKDLLKEAENLFSKQVSNVARIDGDIFIIGDIHGNIRDLLRILATAMPPPKSRYLFLGDYVDRGDYSLECITLLLALAVKFPDHIILIRGNHEYDSVNATYGFMEQVIALYGQSGVYESFNRVFSYMKIAAIVAETTLCVHGGLSPHLNDLFQLEDLDRTLNPPCDLINDIMWSDPSDVVDTIVPSTRGNGCMFGHKFLNQFLNNNNLIRLVRGHECVKNGVRIGKDSKIITVFSSCNYKGEGSNQCGLIKILEDGNFKPFNLKEISILHRENAAFKKVFYEQKNQKINCMIMSSPSMNNMLQNTKISKRSNVGRIPSSGSTIKLKTMRAQRFHSQLNIKKGMFTNGSLPNLANSSNGIHCVDDSNINHSILTNSTDGGDDHQCNEDENNNLQSLTLNSAQPKAPQIKKPIGLISKS